jgi:signal transduction histidine kinase/CheY-like chemotaxis protein
VLELRARRRTGAAIRALLGLAPQTARRIDADGVERIYQEAHIDGVDHYVLAALPRETAMAGAREELWANLILAGAVMLLVTVLGVLMQRSIAKPIKTLKNVIVAAADDHQLDAEPGGPAEIAAVAQAFNVTMNERRQLEGDLADALKEAQRASKLKSEFLANMSHEIRTPMNGVLGMLSVMEDAPMSDEVRDGFRTMAESAGALMSILNELLDFSKLEAGMLSAERVEFNVRDIVRSAVSPWVAIAGNKDVPLVAAVDPDVDEELIGDPNRVRQILTNLVNNAVKFTSRGRITVNVKRLTGDVVRFEVQDSGIGISDEGLRHVFEPFVQADGTTTRRYGGTGLGLAICKQLADIMGGRIGVDSTMGVGSTFWFELPLPVSNATDDDENDGAERARLEAAAVPVTESVLVVDDNLVNQKVATQMLTKLGYQVAVAGDGVEALRAIDAGEFDVVLMDVQMPVMDGWEATTELRRRGQTIPVIAMTAHALEEDRKRCEEVGMDGYVFKPMNVDTLNAELTRVLAPLRASAHSVRAV